MQSEKYCVNDPTWYLKEMVDLDNGSPEEIHKQVEVALREALDSNFEALSNVNIGQVYVPMENSGVHGGGGGRSESKLETPDYDTFGSIDSLIFEPKLGAESQQQVSFERVERQWSIIYLKKLLDSYACPDQSRGKRAKSTNPLINIQPVLSFV